jgi:hypothetical protein
MERIKLKENKDIFKLGIIDSEGNIVKDSNGKEVCLEFDLADVGLPLRYNKCVTLINNARTDLRGKMIIINKRQDHKGKGYLSANEEEKAKAIREFYQKAEEAMDLFLGKGGTKKFLNGRTPYWEMFDDLSEALEPYMDKMKLTVTNMTKRIKDKYRIEEESDVLTNE